MAAANIQVPIDDPTSDFTKCGVCKETINDPKALQCLHTFCLVCLKEWISGDNSSDMKSVVCPACQKTTPLSAEGVEGLPGNFFVSSLMERSKILTPEVNTACICCEESGAELLATCASCEGFLCKKGIESHKTLKFLKTHEVVKLEDLKAGIISKLSSIFTKQPSCDTHKLQPVWLYCETCSELICRDCTLVKHKSPDHVYVELESIATDQRKDIQQVIEKSSKIKTKIKDILQNTKATRDSLTSNSKQAALAIEKAGQTAIDQIRKLVKTEQDKLNEWASVSEKKLTNIEEKLLSQQSQIQRCEEMANQVLKTGSDYDVASIYKQLVNSVEEASSAEYPVLEPGLGQLMFEPDQASLNIQSLGNLALGVRKGTTRKWVLDKEFGQDGQVKVTHPRDVAVTPSGDIAVANYDSSTPVQIYIKTGSLKQSLGMESKYAWNVEVWNDKLFVTRRNKKCVATFNSEGKYLSEFPAVSPKGIKSSDSKSVQPSGLSVHNNSKLLLVGEQTHEYISMHTSDGRHVRSIKSPIAPWYLCTTNQGNIIVSYIWSNVYVMDMTGNQLAEIKPPQSVTSWGIHGICVSHSDEICIVDCINSSVHCFTETGDFISCICKDLKYPTGIALMDNDTRLIVAEQGDNRIKILEATS